MKTITNNFPAGFKQIWGTCYFPSHNAALRYYQQQDPRTTPQNILTKVKEKSINIGRPTAKKNQTVFLNTEEERYFIGEK